MRDSATDVASPLRNGYLVQNPLLNAWLRISDAVMRVQIPRFARDDGKAPASVLVAISGHRGDAIVATVFLESLRQSLPGVRIGVLTGEWNKPVFEGDARIDALHLAHHWRLDRSAGNAFTRWRRSRRAERVAVKEIRAATYDAAVELSPHYPSAARLFRRAGIPRRVGYPTGGGAPLLTHVEQWTPGRTMVDEHLALLDAVISPARPRRVTGGYHLPVASRDSRDRVGELLRERGVSLANYAVIHAGAGADAKVWPAERWREVARAIAAGGTSVVLTGFGAAEAQLNRRIGEGARGIVDLTDRLDWQGMRGVVAGARAVLCADTVAMHLAAADRTPTVAIMTGIWPTDRWRPPVDSVQALSHPVACSPCYRGRGCEHMSCIRHVTPEQVLAAARAHLNASSGAGAAVPTPS